MERRKIMADHRHSLRAISLYTSGGARKYLCGSERVRFYGALEVLERDCERTFCEMIYWTGCRPSEALDLRAVNIDLEERIVVIRSLKKRGAMKGRHYRPVPVPDHFLARLDRVHGLRAARATMDGGEHRLWAFGRTSAWSYMRAVMIAAGLTGAKACSRGLRHSYGVHAAICGVPESRIKSWLGHESLATTAIYLEMAAHEDREIAERMWA